MIEPVLHEMLTEQKEMIKLYSARDKKVNFDKLERVATL